MVNVRMCQPDLLEREVQTLDLGQDTRQVTARVNHCSLHGLVTPNQ
jgi:heat shock protein HslJ